MLLFFETLHKRLHFKLIQYYLILNNYLIRISIKMLMSLLRQKKKKLTLYLITTRFKLKQNLYEQFNRDHHNVEEI